MAKWLGDQCAGGRAHRVTDAGAARYFGEHPVVDLIGLTTTVTFTASASGTRGQQLRTIVTFPLLLPSLRTTRVAVIHRNTTAP